MDLKIEPISPPTKVGEGPFWDEEFQTLYYIDVMVSKLCSYNAKTGAHHSVDVETAGPKEHVSFIIKVKGEKNKFVIGVKNSFATVTWDGVSSEPLVPEHLVEVEVDEKCHLNDGKCDPSNRLWSGSIGHFPEGGTKIEDMEKEQGSLYNMQKDKSVVKRLTKVNCSNGLAWSLDKKKFYYVDSLKYRVDSYDYDDDSGNISNEKTIFDFKKNISGGAPDGMTIDQEGMLWVASYGNGKVLRIDPNTGELLRTLSMPSPEVTSVVFGGPSYEDLYVTTANNWLTSEEREKYPEAGRTFRVTGLGVKGTPSLSVQL